MYKIYKGTYYVSNSGVVESADRIIIDKNGKKYHKKRKALSQRVSDRGYYVTDLMINGKEVRVQVHRLVAELFLENKNKGNIVNHKDLNKLNNDYKNLEWCTQSHNVKHAWEYGARKRKKITLDELINAINYTNTPLECSKALKCSLQRVYGLIKDYGVSIPDRWGKKYNIDYDDIEELCKKYKYGDYAKYAERVGCTQALIVHYKNKYERGEKW